MFRQIQGLGLLILGAAPRLAIAVLVAALLWGLFFWATAPVGHS